MQNVHTVQNRWNVLRHIANLEAFECKVHEIKAIGMLQCKEPKGAYLSLSYLRTAKRRKPLYVSVKWRVLQKR